VAKKRAVADASVLIHFSKSKKLDWLLDAFRAPLLIPPAVYEEAVTQGIKKKEADAIRIDVAVKEGLIQVRKVRKPLEWPFLHRGEAEVLALALDEHIQIVCIDELPARSAAKTLGLTPIGTLGILASLLRAKRVNSLQVLAAVDDLVRRDFRISAKVLDRFRKEVARIG